MSKRKRVNPERIPVSKAQALKERKKATDAFLITALYALLECGADAEFIEQFEGKFKANTELINKDVLSPRTIQKTVMEEYADMMEKLDAAFWMLPEEED